MARQNPFIMRHGPTNRCTRAGPASFSSRACVFRRCVRPRELNRWGAIVLLGDNSMGGGNTQSTQLIRRVESAPPGLKPYHFTLRDDNEQHYHRRMRVIESPVYIELAWRANAKSQVHSLGLFRLDLRGLLSAGYIRSDGPQPDDEVRVRFYRANNGTIYLQTKQGAPALAVAPAPV
jgi:hypothetical protein